MMVSWVTLHNIRRMLLKGIKLGKNHPMMILGFAEGAMIEAETAREAEFTMQDVSHFPSIANCEQRDHVTFRKHDLHSHCSVTTA